MLHVRTLRIFGHLQTCNTFALIGLQRCRRRCLCLAPGRRATRHTPHATCKQTCACLKKRIKNLIENSFRLQIAVIFALCGPLQLLFSCGCHTALVVVVGAATVAAVAVAAISVAEAGTVGWVNINY